MLFNASVRFFEIAPGLLCMPRFAKPTMFYPMHRGDVTENELLPAEFESVAPDCGPPLLFELSLN